MYYSNIRVPYKWLDIWEIATVFILQFEKELEQIIDRMSLILHSSTSRVKYVFNSNVIYFRVMYTNYPLIFRY